MSFATALPDWRERITSGQSLIPPPLYPDEAQLALDVFNELRIVDAPGSPMMRDSCKQWVFDFVASVFGAYNADTGRREMTEWLLLISKKNSKSTIAAGIMLTALIRNWRESGEFLILAPTVEIAQNSFIPARDMIRTSPELADMFQVQEHIRTITHRGTNATLKVVAADSNTVSGKKAIGVLIDEIWLFGKQPQAENMLREATGGLASRPEGFTIFLSTMSDDAPAGVFRQKLNYARGVRDGRIDDDKFVPIIYEFPEAMIAKNEHRNPKNFHITNPNMGVSVDQEFLERELRKAEESGEESLRGFLSKHANVEIGLALMSDRWAGADHWLACTKPRITLDELIERSDVIDAGIDGGGLDDLLGLAVLGRDKLSGRWLLWVRAWAHPTVMERRKSEAARFKDFERDDDLVIVARIGDDVDEVADIIAQVEASGKLDKVGVDPHGLGGILDALVLADVPQEKVIGISQGWKLTGAIKTLERRVASGELEHGGQALMTWCVGNAKVEPRGNAVIITKQASGYAKIDPLLATFNAVSLMSLNPESPASVYDKVDIFVG